MKELSDTKLLNEESFAMQKMVEKMDDEYKLIVKSSDQHKSHYQEIIKKMDEEKQKEMAG